MIPHSLPAAADIASSAVILPCLHPAGASWPGSTQASSRESRGQLRPCCSKATSPPGIQVSPLPRPRAPGLKARVPRVPRAVQAGTDAAPSPQRRQSGSPAAEGFSILRLPPASGDHRVAQPRAPGASFSHRRLPPLPRGPRVCRSGTGQCRAPSSREGPVAPCGGCQSNPSPARLCRLSLPAFLPAPRGSAGFPVQSPALSRGSLSAPWRRCFCQRRCPRCKGPRLQSHPNQGPVANFREHLCTCRVNPQENPQQIGEVQFFPPRGFAAVTGGYGGGCSALGGRRHEPSEAEQPPGSLPGSAQRQPCPGSG